MQKIVSGTNELPWPPRRQTWYLVIAPKYSVIEFNIGYFKRNIEVVHMGKIRTLLGFLRHILWLVLFLL